MYAGALTKKDCQIIDKIKKLALAENKIITPSISDFIKAGYLLALFNKERILPRKLASFTNDCLIAISVISNNATLITSNRKDFELIKKFKKLKVIFIVYV
ncbi:MAG: hypothetical protein AB1297_03715 [bacterium]